MNAFIIVYSTEYFIESGTELKANLQRDLIFLLYLVPIVKFFELIHVKATRKDLWSPDSHFG